MVVGRVLRHVAGELGDLDLILELSLEAGEEHLPLPGLQAVTELRNGPGAIREREEDQLLVDEVQVSQ